MSSLFFSWLGRGGNAGVHGEVVYITCGGCGREESNGFAITVLCACSRLWRDLAEGCLLHIVMIQIAGPFYYLLRHLPLQVPTANIHGPIHLLLGSNT